MLNEDGKKKSGEKMMKQFFRAAVLMCLLALFLSAWSLPAGAASKGTATNGLADQGLSSLNASGTGNVAASPDPRGVGEFDAVAAVSANDVWAVGDGIGTLIEHWNGTLWSLVKSPAPGRISTTFTASPPSRPITSGPSDPPAITLSFPM
jgi:hypothetical protein